MSIEERLARKLTYKMRLNTQARFSLYVLQMPLFKLQRIVKDQIEENPLLEIDSSEYSRLKEGANSEGQGSFGANVGNPFTLAEHLLLQLHLLCNSDRERQIGEEIIGNIDDDGYLRCSVEEMAQSLKVKPHTVERVLSLIQTFEPSGVGARSLRECLMLQLEPKGQLSLLVAQVVDKYLPYLEKKRFSYIAGKLGCSVEDIRGALDQISRLEPKPGRRFNTEITVWLLPDAIVTKTKDGYTVAPNDDALPKLTINNKYREMTQRDEASKDAKQYLRRRLRAARRLIDAIRKRKETVKSVMKEIVDAQRDFIESGSGELNPLTGEQIARRIKKHKSTVSRAVNNKYIQTPWGIYELNYFLSSGIKKQKGGMVSSKTVKTAIVELVEIEKKNNPLTDQKIVDKLKREGILISRRTVTKYRKQLKILSSQSRRK